MMFSGGKPPPTVGQFWRHGTWRTDDAHAIVSIRGDAATFDDGGCSVERMSADSGWQCVGLVTEAGPVMVGEIWTGKTCGCQITAEIVAVVRREACDVDEFRCRYMSDREMLGGGRSRPPHEGYQTTTGWAGWRRLNGAEEVARVARSLMAERAMRESVTTTYTFSATGADATLETIHQARVELDWLCDAMVAADRQKALAGLGVDVSTVAAHQYAGWLASRQRGPFAEARVAALASACELRREWDGPPQAELDGLVAACHAFEAGRSFGAEATVENYRLCHGKPTWFWNSIGQYERARSSARVAVPRERVKR